MSDMMALMIAPISIFLVIVAPLWLVLHYRSKRQLSEGLSVDEKEQLTQLIDRAESMQDRINSLESILDTEVPNWRAN